MYHSKNINGIRKRISPIYNKDWAFVLKQKENQRRWKLFQRLFACEIIIYGNYHI